jgi:hypothetical protein
MEDSVQILQIIKVQEIQLNLLKWITTKTKVWAIKRVFYKVHFKGASFQVQLHITISRTQLRLQPKWFQLHKIQSSLIAKREFSNSFRIVLIRKVKMAWKYAEDHLMWIVPLAKNLSLCCLKWSNPWKYRKFHIKK